MARTKVWKDALYCGTWITPKGQVYHCGPNDLRHFRDRTKAQLAAGMPLPWVFEHPRGEGDTALSANELQARWAKSTGGHIHDLRVSPNDVLEVLLDVDDTDRPKLEALKYVSPDIRHNFRDRNGPACDASGIPYWPGQSFSHIAVTGMPVQYPQAPFDFSQTVSLSAATVDVSLSSAVLTPDKKDKSMPIPPKPKDDDKPDAPPIDDETGEDLEGAGPIADIPPPPAEDGKGADEAAAMKELEHELAELGIEFHASAHEDTTTFVQHLISCIKTHKATKAGGAGTAIKPDPIQPDQDPTPTNQEAETSESAPIMMSATTIDHADLAKKFGTKLLKQSLTGLSGRIATAHAKGWIDDAIRKDLEGELGTVSLSMADLTEDGDVKPCHVAIKLDMLERLAKSGKTGPFARVPAKAAPTVQANPSKPISTAVALSSLDDEEAIRPPGMEDTGAADRKAQEEAGDELASLAGYPTKR